MESLRQRVHQLEDRLMEKQAKDKRFAEFSEIDTVFVSSLSDKELAGWQAQYPADSPQFIIANHEWQRRLNLEQIKANRHSAYIGLVGVVIGVALTSFFTYINDSYNKDNTIKQAPPVVVEPTKDQPIKLNKSKHSDAAKAAPGV